MTIEEKEQYYKFFVDTWGEDAQLKMCIEEMAELTQAICKYMRFKEKGCPPEVMYNLHEEIADVANMIGQMEYIFDKQKIEEIQIEKLNRCVNKIKGSSK